MSYLDRHISKISFIFLIVIWQVSVSIFDIPSYILPAPSLIISTLVTNFNIIVVHTGYTVSEAVLGVGLAIVLGILVAISLFRSSRLERLLMPYFSILQTIPAIVIAPLFAIWFGFGLFPKVLLIVIFCSFPIIVGSVSSFKQVSSEAVLYLRTLGATDYQLFRHLYLPAAAPGIFASIKISTTYALVNAIFAEYMGAKYGLGVYLNRAAASFSSADVFAVIIVIIAVTLSLLQIVSYFQKKIIKWSVDEPTTN